MPVSMTGRQLFDGQCGFRPNRSTIDALLRPLRLLCNGAWDKGKTLHTCVLGLADLAQQGRTLKACGTHQRPPHITFMYHMQRG